MPRRRFTTNTTPALSASTAELRDVPATTAPMLESKRCRAGDLGGRSGLLARQQDRHSSAVGNVLGTVQRDVLLDAREYPVLNWPGSGEALRIMLPASAAVPLFPARRSGDARPTSSRPAGDDPAAVLEATRQVPGGEVGQPVALRGGMMWPGRSPGVGLARARVRLVRDRRQTRFAHAYILFSEGTRLRQGPGVDRDWPAIGQRRHHLGRPVANRRLPAVTLGSDTGISWRRSDLG